MSSLELHRDNQMYHTVDDERYHCHICHSFDRTLGMSNYFIGLVRQDLRPCLHHGHTSAGGRTDCVC